MTANEDAQVDVRQDDAQQTNARQTGAQQDNLQKTGAQAETHRPKRPISSAFMQARPVWLAVIAVVFTSMMLRPAATTVGPALAQLQEQLHLSSTVAGLLTALPGFAFTVFGVLANRIVPRIGLISTLILAAFLTFMGMMARVLTGSAWVFLGLTVLALAGMAIGNVVLPAFVKVGFPKSAAAMSTVYTVFLAFNSGLPPLLATVFSGWGESWLGEGNGWRTSLGLWALVPLIAVLLWLPLARKNPKVNRTPAFQKKPSIPMRVLLRSPLAVCLMLFFGLQSMNGYVLSGWLPTMYEAGGVSAEIGAIGAGIYMFGGAPGGLLMPRLLAKGKGTRWWIVSFGIAMIIGYLGMCLCPQVLPLLWAVLLSYSGFCFPTALALIILRTRKPEVTAAVSGFVQPIGYFLAGLGPLLVGVAIQAIGSWVAINVVFAVLAVVLTGFGIVSCRDRMIDDEISLPRANKEVKNA